MRYDQKTNLVVRVSLEASEVMNADKRICRTCI